MSNFTPAEIEYLQSQRLGRLATVDDVLPPWRARGIEVRGRVQALPEGGKEIMKDFAPEILRITPTHLVSWGINDENFLTSSSSRKVE